MRRVTGSFAANLNAYLSGRIYLQLKFDLVHQTRVWEVRLGHSGFGEVGGNKRSHEIEERYGILTFCMLELLL